jgi:uracil-DNA glycosylase
MHFDALGKLYVDIWKCHLCPRMDREKATRLIQSVNTESDVFIISQALAANQLRKSGVNFFQADGRLGNTGKSLEVFLNSFGRTVYPQGSIAMPSGTTIPECNVGYITAYNTEMAQCYPGKNAHGSRDRAPSKCELQRCVGKGFLVREIKLIRPRLLLLMGRASRDTFFDYVLKAEYPQSLTEYIRRIVQNGRVPRFTLGHFSFHVLPIQHASGADPRFHHMLQDRRVTELIKEVLDG